MTHEEFLQWLDDQINFYDLMLRKIDNTQETYLSYQSAKGTLKLVKEKFLTLLPPPTTLS